MGLTAVDETALALVDLALRHHRNLTIVYPAPAGEVSVLLAAEILLQRFVRLEPSQAIGIVTSDASRAQQSWEELTITSGVERAVLNEVFPVFRAGPFGESPVGRRRFRGAMIGRRFVDWPVDALTIDYLSGPVDAQTDATSVRVFADPLDPELERLASQGELIWGFAEGDLAMLASPGDDGPSSVPFSVAAERLQTMAAGVNTTIHVAHNPNAEELIRRLRDDLHTLSGLAPSPPPFTVRKGMRVAWHHVSTLASLPCRPSEYDLFAGIPPIAARDTTTFEPEIAAWARTLDGDLREVAEIVASDIGELRAVLDDVCPFTNELSELALGSGVGTVIVVSTRTAARGLLQSVRRDPESNRLGPAEVVSLRRLHTMGTCARAIFVGTPAPWDWHRLDSGLSPDLHVLVLGDLRHALTSVGADGLEAEIHAEIEDVEAAARSADSQVPIEHLNSVTLTGRTPLEEVRSTLERLTNPEDDFDSRIHLVAASSMLSHGVDIDRLNVMVMLGLPLSTSEFFQTTSRVGRRLPGLVIVLHKIGRERDAAIFRVFPSFIQHMERLVDPVPITSKSRRVLELTFAGLQQARLYGIHEPAALAQGLRQLTLPAAVRRAFTRLPITEPAELRALIEMLGFSGPLDENLRNDLANYVRQFYRALNDPATTAQWVSDLFPTGEPMCSLRDVEEQVPVYSRGGTS